jgi:hypothetical protein
LFGDEIVVKRFGLVDPVLDIRFAEDGSSNIDIAKEDSTAVEEAPAEEGGAFKMKLKEYFIKNGTINYDDRTMPMIMKFEGLNHEGTGDFTQDLFKLVTTTHADKATFWFDGITYFNEVKADLQADIDMDMKNSKYTLAGNTIKLNALELGAQGWVAMPGEDINMDISFNALKNDFKQFLSMVPLEFAKDVQGVDATGNLAFNGFVRGTYNDNSMPAVGMELAIDNEYFMLAEKATDFLCLSRSLYLDQESLVDLDKIEDSELLLLRVGCVQFISGNGLTAKRPFLNLGMDGFCFLMKFLGFKFKQQSIESSSPVGIIDKALFQDKTGNEITLYNLLEGLD